MDFRLVVGGGVVVWCGGMVMGGWGVVTGGRCLSPVILDSIRIPICFKTEGGSAHIGCIKEALSQPLRQQ